MIEVLIFSSTFRVFNLDQKFLIGFYHEFEAVLPVYEEGQLLNNPPFKLSKPYAVRPVICFEAQKSTRNECKI